jgi:ketosteroid isomerase-like protein
LNDDAVEIVRRYNDVWLQRDLAAMAAYLGDDLVLWHNHIGQEFGKEQMLGFVGAALDVLTKVEFRNVRRTASETGCVQQHDLYCEMADGSVVPGAPQVIVYTVRDGLIRRIEEYIDGPALAAVHIMA